MRVLMTGRGSGGSWQVRGVQLGRAMGATVMPEARDGGTYDVVVLVKRNVRGLLDVPRRGGAPIVWDIVDAYPQPQGNDWERDECLAWLEQERLRVRPDAIVAATQAMARDCEQFGVPVLTLPHHARPGLRRNPTRERVLTVGYEGAEHYIDKWRPVIEAECAQRGWRFVMQPAELADVDIVLALRDSTGYAPRFWKSGVKLANAQGSGTPIVCCREAGYLETHSGGEQWADTPQELAAAFDALTPHAARVEASRKLLAAAPTLERIADTYSSWLRETFGAR